MSSAGNQAIAFTLKALLDANPEAIKIIKNEIERLDKIWDVSDKEMQHSSILVDKLLETEKLSRKLKDIIGMEYEDENAEQQNDDSHQNEIIEVENILLNINAGMPWSLLTEYECNLLKKHGYERK